MRSATALRRAIGALAVSRIGAPSSQLIVSSRRVDSSGSGSGTATPASPCRIVAVEPHMRGLAPVIELLAQPVGDLGMDLSGGDGAVVALVEAHRELQLAQIGFDRGAHVRILQLAGERRAVERPRPMHLAERGGARRGLFEAAEPALPVGAEFAGHAAPDERPAHRRRIRLQLHQLLDIFLGQRVGDRGQQLRHLHQRPLDPAERRLQIGGMAPAVDGDAQIALAGEPRRQPAHRSRHLRIAPHPPGKGIVVGHCLTMAQPCATDASCGGTKQWKAP